MLMSVLLGGAFVGGVAWGGAMPYCDADDCCTVGALPADCCAELPAEASVPVQHEDAGRGGCDPVSCLRCVSPLAAGIVVVLEGTPDVRPSAAGVWRVEPVTSVAHGAVGSLLRPPRV